MIQRILRFLVLLATLVLLIAVFVGLMARLASNMPMPGPPVRPAPVGAER
jgi:hypothetical protein